jgi:anti-anti-sigma regulatory factor/HAMP domain-containing protein
MPIEGEMPRTSRSLTATLAIAFLALSVVVLLIASSLEMYFNFQTQREIVASKQQLIAQDAANTVTSFIQERYSVLESAVKLGNPASASQEEQKRVLESLLGLEPAFRQLVLLDSQEQELAKASRLSQAASGQLTDRVGSDLFAQTRQGKRYISPVYIDEVTSEPLVIMAVPATDAFGDFQGTLMAEVNLKFMWDLVDRLEIGETGLAYVVDRQGNLIAFGDIARVLRGENVSHLKEVGEFVNSPSPVDETGAGLSTGINGAAVFGTYVPLGTPDWAVVTELPVVEAYRGVIRGVAISLGVMLAVAMLAGLIGVNMARRLAVPLLNLTETATRIAEGEMDLQAAIEGPTEVASLAGAFNNMTGQLREMLRKEEERAAERERLQQEVIEAQKQAIQELSTPIIPVMDRIIVMPLIGSIDTMRARDITRRLLAGIREHRARVVILDITGVPIVDSGVADYLNKTIQAARLKGAQTIVTGISDAVAEAIVDLGIDWSRIETLSDLQMGLIGALNSLGIQLTR